jgi:hypothetical protein
MSILGQIYSEVSIFHLETFIYVSIYVYEYTNIHTRI